MVTKLVQMVFWTNSWVLGSIVPPSPSDTWTVEILTPQHCPKVKLSFLQKALFVAHCIILRILHSASSLPLSLAASNLWLRCCLQYLCPCTLKCLTCWLHSFQRILEWSWDFASAHGAFSIPPIFGFASMKLKWGSVELAPFYPKRGLRRGLKRGSFYCRVSCISFLYASCISWIAYGFCLFWPGTGPDYDFHCEPPTIFQSVCVMNSAPPEGLHACSSNVDFCCWDVLSWVGWWSEGVCQPLTLW